MGLSSQFLGLLACLWGDFLGLDRLHKELVAEIALIAEMNPVAKRLQQLCRVGSLIATAMAATVATRRNSPTARRWQLL